MSRKIEVSTVRDANVVSAGGVSPLTGASHANAGATASSAPYLFSFETERSVNAAELAVIAQAEVNRGTVTEAELAINAIQGVLVDLAEQYGAITASTSFGTFVTRCEGSVDDPFSLPEDGSIYLDFDFSDAQRREFAKIEARVPATGEKPRIVRTTQYFPAAGGTREKTLVLGEEFTLEGVNITYGGQGESLELWNDPPTQKVCDITVGTHESKNLWLCTLPNVNIQPGKYWLVMNTLGGGDKLERVTHDVNVEGEYTPSPIAQTSDGQVKVMSLSGGTEGVYTFGDTWTAAGEGFRDSEAGWFVELGMLLPTAQAEPVNVDCRVTSATAMEIAPAEGAELAAGDYPNAVIQVGMAKYVDDELVSETLTLPIHLVVG